MPTELAKTFEPASTQQQALDTWKAANAFHAEPADGGKPYSIVIPPPNVTAALHLGHALNNTLQDILIRWHRMLGDNTCWLPGTDHAGIATQTVVEKRVLAEEGKRRTDFARDDFVKKIQAWKDEYEARITSQLKAMGCSCDWQRQAFTMDEQRAKAVREAFFQLFKDGLIYRGKRLVNWDPATQTALADDEVEMEEVDGHFYYLQYPLDDGSGHVTVATTRPETMLGDTAVAVNPKDPRAAGLRGKKVRLPIVDRVIPIIEDDYVVLPDANSDDAKARYATGFLKVTPAHDPNDYELGKRQNLPMINVMAPDGTISDQHGWSDVGGAEFVLGLDRYEAREAIVEWFRKNKLFEDIKPYRHSVGHSYRSHVAIEPYLSDQWYVKVTDDRLAGAALRAMAEDQRDRGTGASPVQIESKEHGRDAHATWEGQLRFYPARYAKTFQTWHENIRDWCISRQLWWGHRIPVWSKRCEAADLDVFHTLDQVLPDSLEDVLELGTSNQCALRIVDNETAEILRPTVIEFNHGIGRAVTIYIALRDDAVGSALEHNGFDRDPDVLDTWFSSALWPLSTLDWPSDSALRTQHSALNFWNPTSVLCTAREIITLWVSRMVMFNLYFLNRLPFSDVFVHAMIQDGEGRKMSKSLGNGVDPLDIIDSHGADALRFTLAHMATNTQDVRMPVERDARTGKNTSPKFDAGRNFCNKIWNAARFVLSILENLKTEQSPISTQDSALRTQDSLSLPDRWILSRFRRAVADADNALKDYRFDQYAKACYDFFWGDFCDWYIEAAKPALRDPARSAQTASVIASVLDASLRLLHPAMPFITEVIYQKLNEIRPQRGLPGLLACEESPLLLKAKWPASGKADEDAEKTFPVLQQVIQEIRNVRNSYKIDPKKPVPVSLSASIEAAKHLAENRELIEMLCPATLKAVGPDLAPPENAVRSSAAGIDIYIEGLIDPAAEQQRIAKLRDDLTKKIATLKGRLSNESYTAKAPPHLVQQTKDQLAAAEAELAKLG